MKWRVSICAGCVLGITLALIVTVQAMRDFPNRVLIGALIVVIGILPVGAALLFRRDRTAAVIAISTTIFLLAWGFIAPKFTGSRSFTGGWPQLLPESEKRVVNTNSMVSVGVSPSDLQEILAQVARIPTISLNVTQVKVVVSDNQPKAARVMIKAAPAISGGSYHFCELSKGQRGHWQIQRIGSGVSDVW